MIKSINKCGIAGSSLNADFCFYQFLEGMTKRKGKLTENRERHSVNED